MLQENEKLELLSTVSIFAETPRNVLEELSGVLKQVACQPGDPIIIKGEEGDCMYIIESGQVKVHDGTHLIATIGERKIFGELSLLNPEPRSASVTAINNTYLLRLDREDFYKIVATRSEVLKGMIKMLIDRIRTQNNSIIESLKAREKELEELVNQRTAELQFEKQNLELANEEINQQREELSKKNESINSSINYAKRIQFAMLPEFYRIQQPLPDSFVLFKPRDVVSGDFYWFSRREDKTIIAAVDCTGHGIPGALMSMIGNMLLNQIVIERRITTPGEILESLNFGVRKALKQDDEESQSRDGMDAALACIDHKTQQLYYAGAHRPLYYIDTNGDLQEIKGTKSAIGGSQSNNVVKYESHLVDLQTARAFYMSSDGYPDQFGGPDNRKFMNKRFKKLLTDIHQKPFDEQRTELDQIIENWKGPQAQIDDILVIGFKSPV